MRFIISATLLLVGCTQPQQSCGMYQNVYGQRIQLPKLPVTLFISNTIPRDMIPSIHKAAKTWELATGRKTFNLVEMDVQSNSVNSIYYLKEWDRGPAEQAVTTVSWADESIQKFVIKINGNYSFYIGTQVKNAYSFEALMLHEMGHALGLVHQYENSVMVTHLSAENDRINLYPKDIANIKCGYADLN